jgi:hypothetical protein
MILSLIMEVGGVSIHPGEPDVLKGVVLCVSDDTANESHNELGQIREICFGEVCIRSFGVHKGPV